MADKQEQTALQRWGSKKQPWWFLVIVATVISALIWGAFLLLQSSREGREAKIRDLNERYFEQIDIKLGSNDRDLIVIDGKSRYDCSEEHLRLTCSDDPQPTAE